MAAGPLARRAEADNRATPRMGLSVHPRGCPARAVRRPCRMESLRAHGCAQCAGLKTAQLLRQPKCKSGQQSHTAAGTVGAPASVFGIRCARDMPQGVAALPWLSAVRSVGDCSVGPPAQMQKRTTEPHRGRDCQCTRVTGPPAQVQKWTTEPHRGRDCRCTRVGVRHQLCAGLAARGRCMPMAARSAQCAAWETAHLVCRLVCKSGQPSHTAERTVGASESVIGTHCARDMPHGVAAGTDNTVSSAECAAWEIAQLVCQPAGRSGQQSQPRKGLSVSCTRIGVRHPLCLRLAARGRCAPMAVRSAQCGRPLSWSASPLAEMDN